MLGPGATGWNVRRKLPAQTPTSIQLAAPTPVRSFPGFRAAAEWSVRRHWSVRRPARQMCVGHSRCSSTEIDALARQRNSVVQRWPHLQLSVRTDCAPASTKHRTSDSSLKQATATPEYGRHPRSHRPNQCRPLTDTEEGHADHNSSQNTRTIISRRFALLPERHAARGKPSRKVSQNQFSTVVHRSLGDHRESLVAERTQAINRLRWYLHELDPSWEPKARSLDRLAILDKVSAHLDPFTGTVVRLARGLLDRCRALTKQINELTAEITTLVADMAPSLIAIPGCGAITAAKILGETAGVDRFRSKDAYARHNGTAPMPVWSSNRAQPYRESPTQRGPAPARADPGALARTSKTDD